MSCKSLSLFLCVILCCVTAHATPWSNHGREDVQPLLVRKDERVSLVSTEYGEISAVHIGEGAWEKRSHLQFITLEPNALFLPALLHADMVFYVHSGVGRLSWADEDGIRHVKLKRGDVFRLRPGSIFFVQSNLETERRKLRIYAIFTNPLDNLHEPAMGAYSRIRDLVLGFDKEVLQAAFQAPKEMIEELTSATRQPAIVHAPTSEKKEKSFWEIDSQYLEVISGHSGSMFDVNKKKSGTKSFNIFDEKPDFKNRYGKSLIVTKKNLPSLKRPDLSIFMVNLTAGSMMGPHWNPMASEVSIVLQGEGMIHMVGPSTKNKSANSQNTRFHVEEGDVFVIPRFHPMAQMAFTNDSFVFMGFSSTTKRNHPQFLAGKASVLRTLDKQIVASSFGVKNMSTFDRFLDQQGESVILKCTSCAEEEFRIVEEEMKRRIEEDERRQREEEERKREEEEKKRREETKTKRREEEARRRREEEARREEEEAKRQEDERRRREEEEVRRREEIQRREEEEEARREEEERAKKEEEEARREEEEEARQRREEEEEARIKKEEERARREEEESRREEEEEARQRREEEKEARRKEEEKRAREEEEARREEEERRRQEEEERQRKEEEEEAQKAEGERKRRQEEEIKREEEARRRREEEARREDEEAERQEKERRQREEEEERQRREEEKEARKEEEEQARRQEEEEEEARRREEKEKKVRRQEKQEEEEEGAGSDDERRRATRRIWKHRNFIW